MKYYNEDTYATNSGGIKLSHEKLKELLPELYGLEGLKMKLLALFKLGINQQERIQEHIYYGDSQPAIVFSENPLLLAAYSEDLDCIAMLKFPERLKDKYNLKVGSRLISINTYFQDPPYQKDLIIGRHGGWFGFHPIIAEFVSDDISVFNEKKEEITKEQWDYVYSLAQEYTRINPDVWRDGRPIYSEESAI